MYYKPNKKKMYVDKNNYSYHYDGLLIYSATALRRVILNVDIQSN